jgi:hypothetical protein
MPDLEINLDSLFPQIEQKDSFTHALRIGPNISRKFTSKIDLLCLPQFLWQERRDVSIIFFIQYAKFSP